MVKSNKKGVFKIVLKAEADFPNHEASYVFRSLAPLVVLQACTIKVDGTNDREFFVILESRLHAPETYGSVIKRVDQVLEFMREHEMRVLSKRVMATDFRYRASESLPFLVRNTFTLFSCRGENLDTIVENLKSKRQYRDAVFTKVRNNPDNSETWAMERLYKSGTVHEAQIEALRMFGHNSIDRVLGSLYTSSKQKDYSVRTLIEEVRY